MKKLLFLVFAILIVLNFNTFTAKAEVDIEKEIEEQISQLDLSEFEGFLVENNINIDFQQILKEIVSGNYELNYSNIFEFIYSSVKQYINEYILILLSVSAICLVSLILKSVGGESFNSEVSDIIFFVCFLASLIIILSMFFSVYQKTKNTLQTLMKLNEIMSPIMLTLMMATGANYSASIIKPSVIFLSNGIFGVVLNFCIPIILVVIIFNTLTYFTDSIKFNKFIDFFNSLLKWAFGLILLIYSSIITIKGLNCGLFDTLNLKTAKYTISNFIPVVGNLLGDNLDLILMGSIIIKNGVGIVGIITILTIIIPVILEIICLSLTLKLTAGFTENIGDKRIADYCSSVSKSISFLVYSTVICSILLFISLFVMILSVGGY